MPRQKKALSKGLKELADGTIECTPCSQFGERKHSIFTRNGRKRHEESPQHVGALRRAEDEASLAAAAAAAPRDLSAATLRAAPRTLGIHQPVASNDHATLSNGDPLTSVNFHDGLMYDGEGNAIVFSAGPQETEQERLWRSLDQATATFNITGSMDSWIDQIAPHAEDDATRTNVDMQLDGLGGQSDEEDDISEDEDSLADQHTTNRQMRAPLDDPWYPHGSKTMFVLDMLDNLPRLRLSSDHFRVILWVLKELGVRGVPSFSKFRKKQDELNRACGIHTDAKRSPQGDIFYQNRVADIIALDYANPQTRPHIEIYPIRSRTVSETYHSKRVVHDTDPDSGHTPMWAAGHMHWYIGELAMLRNGKLVIPRAWYRYESRGEVFGEGYEVAVNVPEEGHQTSESHFEVQLGGLVEFRTSDLHVNYPELEGCALGGRLSGPLPKGVFNGPNPLRAQANGRRMYTSYIKAWGDDVSGNKSKQYNEHTNIYIAHANLPHTKLSQEYFVRFTSTSPHATAGAQFDAMVDSITGANTWHSAYDCDPEVQEEVLFRIIPRIFPADNPQQSESCSHIGLHGNFWCRGCKLGGSEKERETDQNYDAHFEVNPSNLRTSTETREEILTQIRLAALGVKKDVTQRQTDTGTKDKLAEHWIKILLERARKEQQHRITTATTADPRLKRVHGPERTAIVLTIKKEIQVELLEWLHQENLNSLMRYHNNR
ncbi:uncharacterized protein C8Q71DRAFT_863689 [Rhodofomes roseus]|uniref:Uncharacterized protein n=1 Tax=Rhodofomes roseus TaxID=34475 RepID=A0ABQ8JXJ7_9APHY|nr:uncharacterized protein C8Q71DRAFT_863689 [Rhodofomes roseus]KAH9828833.1 hypothetical protein C8Q71DRAFT_863689 [Rhodofomes roseus]